MATFPGARQFAFTIFDDTDSATVENVRPVYRLLNELGFRTTKSVWVLPSGTGPFAGSCLMDPDYRHFILDLKQDGFEIALHNVRNSGATRDVVERGLDKFVDIIGDNPRSHANHYHNEENIYWGTDRLNGSMGRFLYRLATRGRYDGRFRGQHEDSPYFWGDICKRRIAYVRNLVFRNINLARVSHAMPYHDPSKPFVNYWFSACDGARGKQFCELLSERNQDRLEAEGGICIVYTHFAYGFVESGQLNPRFVSLMRRLARKNGWYIPTTELLDHLRVHQKSSVLSADKIEEMEQAWLGERLPVTRLNCFPMRRTA